MLLKLLITLGVIYIVYTAFFKKSALTNTKTEAKKKDEDDSDELVSCVVCKTYTTRDDAIISLGKHYCSNACVGKAS